MKIVLPLLCVIFFFGACHHDSTPQVSYDLDASVTSGSNRYGQQRVLYKQDIPATAPTKTFTGYVKKEHILADKTLYVLLENEQGEQFSFETNKLPPAKVHEMLWLKVVYLDSNEQIVEAVVVD